MNNGCKYANISGGCLCSTCQAVRKAMEDAENITREEVDKILHDAEKALQNIELPEKELPHK